MLLDKLKNMVLKIYYRKKTHNVRFSRGTVIDSKCKIENDVFLGKGAVIKMSHIGHHTYVADNSNLSRVSIGNYCSIGPFVNTAIGSHPTRKFVSTHPAFYSKSDEHVLGYSYVDEDIFEEYPGIDTPYGKKSIVIGNDVWIGSNVTIIEGVRIGDGAIIGAGTVVRKDIPDYAIVTGNPATIIRYRFDSKIIQKLKEIQWWTKSERELKQNALLFSDVDCFLGEYCDEFSKENSK